MTDTIIVNSKVITFDGRDAQALAISGETITAVGSNKEIQALAGSAQGYRCTRGNCDARVYR